MWFRIILLLILIAVILAFKFLPWYALVGLAVVFVLFGKLLGKKLFLWLFSLPFRAKGMALRGATVEVHSIQPCAAPERSPEEMDPTEDEDAMDDEDDSEGGKLIKQEEAKEPRNYYRVETIITPKHYNQAFQFWEIGEVGLGLPNHNPMRDTEDDSCQVEGLEVELDGKFTPDDGYKLKGPQRLRFVIAVRPDVNRLVFNYYFERFGEISIPAGS